MSYFKRFTDLFSGIGIFFAAVYFVGKYMAYDPGELEEGMSKLKMFLYPDSGKEYKQYIIFIGLLLLCVTAGRILKRCSVIALCLSTLPILQTANMVYSKMLYDDTEFFVAVAFVTFAGGIYECYYRDKTEGTYRTYYGTNAIGAVAALMSFAAIKINSLSGELYEVFMASELDEGQQKIVDTLELFGIDAIKALPENESRILIFVCVALLVSVVISLIFKGAYFIDIVTSAVPFVISVYAWNTESLEIAPMLLLVPTFVYLICRIVLFVSGVGVCGKMELNIEKDTN